MLDKDKARKIGSVVKNLIRLDHYNFTFLERESEEVYQASLHFCDYTHFNATIKLCFEDINKKMKEDFSGWEEVIQLILHEMCHIYTGSGTWKITENEDTIDYHLWKKDRIFLYNWMMDREEQMTILLERCLWKKIKDSKEIKELLLSLEKNAKERETKNASKKDKHYSGKKDIKKR